MAGFEVTADAYGRFMGRFSLPLAPRFADLGLDGVPADGRALDVGCGPGHITAFLAEVKTRADDLAVFQYTSGTTRELPEAVKHTHRALVTLMVAALY